MTLLPSEGSLSELTEKNASIIEMIVRFGLLTAKVLAEKNQGKCDSARKSLDRLVDDGWLVRHKFPNGQTYYVLSTQACNRLSLKRNGNALRQRPFIKRSLVLFHFSQNPHLRLLAASECSRLLPALYRRGAANLYFFNGTTNSLGWICLDDGKPSRRVHSKVVQQAAKRRMISAIRDLSASNRFYYLILTTSAEKVAQIREHFTQRPVHNSAIEIAAVPECCSLFLPKTKGVSDE